MSRTIDEKVVEMRFDNSNFEQNVSQSMSTLDKLKSALDFSGIEEAFSGISSAANKVNMGGLTGALDGVSEKFSQFAENAINSFVKIGTMGVDWLGGKIKDTLKDLTLDAIGDGFDKYADKTKSVQTIMNATGKSIEEVSEQLDRLMWYTDETSYDFTEMTASIGKFTSAGIDLETAVTAMMGIGNWAGVSGAGKNEANRAMYNISQALSTGYMRKEDWKSIENANMATKEFKEMVIQSALALGALEEFEDGLIGVVKDAQWDEELGKFVGGTLTFEKEWSEGVNFKNMANTLTEGKWLTNEVLTATLDMYGKFTNELNDVYEDMNENAEVTTSQIIKMTNQWLDNTLDMDQAMAMTGKSAEELEEILSSLGREEYALGRKALAAAQEARTFQDAIDATKDAVSSGWMRTFEIIFGNYEEAKELWTDLANELWDIFAGPISNINDVLTAWRNNDTLGDGRDDLIEGIKDIYRALRSVVDPIIEAWEAIFPPATYEDIWNFTHAFREFTESLILSDERVEILRNTFEGIFGVIKLVTDGVGSLIRAFTDNAFEGGSGFFNGIFIALEEVSNGIETFLVTVSRISSAVNDFKNDDWLGIVEGYREQYPILTWMVETFDKLKDTLAILGEYVGKLFRLNDLFLYYGEAGEGLAGVVNIISRGLLNIVDTISNLIQVWTGFDVSKYAEGIKDYILAWNRLVDASQSSGWLDRLKKEFDNIFVVFEERFGSVSSWFEPLKEAFFSVLQDLVKGFEMLFGEEKHFSLSFLATWAKNITDFVRDSEILGKVIDKFKGLVKVVSDFLSTFLSFSDAVSNFQKNGGGLSGILDVIRSKIKSILDLISGVIKETTGLDFSWIVSMANSLLLVANRLVLGAVTATKKIGDIFDAFKERFGAISDWFAPIHRAFESIAQDFGVGLSVLMFLGSDKKEGFSFLSDWVDGIVDFVQHSKLLGTVVDTFKGLIEVVSEFLSDFLSLFDIITTYNKGGGGLSGILDVLQEKLRNVMDLAAGVIKVFTGIDLTWLSDMVVNVFGIIKTVVLKASDAVKGFFALFKKDQSSDFDEFGNETEKKLTPLQVFFEGLKKLFEGIWSVLQALKPVFEAILGKVGEVFGSIGSSLVDAFQNTDATTALDLISKGLKIALTGGLLNLLNSIASPFKEFGGMFKGVKEVLDGVKDALGAWQKELQSKTLLKIAAAIGIITVAVIALSGVDSEKLGKALSAITLLFVELFGAMGIGKELSGDAISMKAMTDALLKISAAILIASIAFNKIGKMDWDGIRKGTFGMGVALGEMVAALKIMPKDYVKDGVTMIEIAVSLLLVASVLKKIGDMNWDALNQGLYGMMVALAELSLAIIAINKFGGGITGGMTMIEVAISLLLVASVLKKIGDMGWDDLNKGLLGMMAALAEVSLAVIAINKFGGDIKGGVTLILVAASLKILASALEDFGDLEWEPLIRGLIGMGGALAEVVLAINFMPPAQTLLAAIGLAAMSGALILLTIPLKTLGSMSLGEIIKSLVALAGAFVVIGGLGAIFGTVSAQLILFSVGLAAVSAALLLLIPSLMLLGSMSLGEIIKSLVTLVGVFAVLGAASLVLAPLTPVILLLAGALTLLGVSVLAAGAGLSLLATAFELLASVGMAGISVLLATVSGLISLIPKFATALFNAFISIIKMIGDNAATIAEAVVNIVSAILDAAQVLIPKLIETVVTIIDELLKSIAEHGPSIVESVVALTLYLLEAIAEHLPEFVQAGIDIVFNLVEGLADGLVENTERAKEAFGKLFDSILESILLFLGVDKGKAEKFVEIAHSMISGLVSGIAEFATEILTEVSNLMNKIIEKVKGKIPDLKEAGKNVAEGLKNGITSAKDKAVETAQNLASSVGGAIKKVLRIESPSKETEEDGEYFDLGLAKGIDENAYVAEESAEDLANSVGDKLLGGIEETFPTAYDDGESMIYNIADGAYSALETVEPELNDIGETMGDKILDGFGNVIGRLEYIDLPDGVKSMSPILDFGTLKMQADEYDAYIGAFKSATKEEQDMMIREMGADYQAEGLANYLRQIQLGIVPDQSLINSSNIAMADEYGQTIVTEISNNREEYSDSTVSILERLTSIEETENNIYGSIQSIDTHGAAIREIIRTLNDMDVYIDSDALVGATASKFNEELGNMTKIGQRGVTR